LHPHLELDRRFDLEPISAKVGEIEIPRCTNLVAGDLVVRANVTNALEASEHRVRADVNRMSGE
jgi:hypothetical protein